jgi:hypothetical protein
MSSKQVYYQVRGQRALYKKDLTATAAVDAMPLRTGTSKDSYLRFESLSLSEAEAFATGVYKRESIICTIDEHDGAQSGKH